MYSKRVIRPTLVVIVLFSISCARGASDVSLSKAESVPHESKNNNTHVTVLDMESPLEAHAFLNRVHEAGGNVSFIFEEERPFLQCHASTITEAPDGTLVAAWFGGTKEKHPDVAIWTTRYCDGNWTSPHKTAKVEESAHWNPVLFTDAQGTVHLFFKVGPEIPYWRTYWMNSKDNGISWSEPRELVPGDAGGRGPVKNKPILLSNGSWLAPASTELRRWEAFADRSEDNGFTWHRSENFVLDRSLFKGPGAIQPTFWESAPGVVHALLRTSFGRIVRTDSMDYGKTWTPLYDSGLPNNNSGIDALRLEDGRVLLVLNPIGTNWGPRTPLSLAISHDNGSTWKLLAHFEDDPPESKYEYSYPAIICTKNGVAVSYTYRRERIRCWQIPLPALQVAP